VGEEKRKGRRTVFRQILLVRKVIVVTDVDLTLQCRDEGSLDLSKSAEGEGGEKGLGLKLDEIGDSTAFVAGNQSSQTHTRRRGYQHPAYEED
jgi:hypothetical protein